MSTRATRWLGVVQRVCDLAHRIRLIRPGASSRRNAQRTDGRGADAVLVAVPNPSLVPEALSLARPGGRVLLFAHNDPVLQLEFPAAAVGIEEKEILGKLQRIGG